MNNQQSHWFSLSCAVALAAAAAACAGKLENPEDFTTGGSSGSGTGGGAGAGTGGSGTGGSAGADTQAFNPPPCAVAVFKSCSNVGCHSAGAGAAQDLHLDAASLMNPANYKDVGPKADPTAGSTCMTGKIVDSAAPAQSLLYTKITNQTCGLKMPIGNPLTDVQTACVLQWIQSIPGVATGSAATGGTGGAGGGTGGAGGATGGAAGATGAGGATGGAAGATGGASGAGAAGTGGAGGGGARDAGGGARDAGAGGGGGGGNVVRDAARG